MITSSVFARERLTVFDSIGGTVFDGLEFARGGGVLERSIGLGELPRLADLLVSTAGRLTVRIEGWRDEAGKSWLQLDIAGRPLLCCQRCLGSVEVPLVIASRLQLIASGEQWPDDDLEDDSADAISAEKDLAVLDLVEDEVLLALPIAPRHEQCESPLALENGHGSSPFAALVALKTH
jgi:uncharacterized protein